MKRYHWYQMDVDCKASWLSGICMALPVFLLCVYYLFQQEIGSVPVGKQILYLWTPIALSIGYLVLLRIVRLKWTFIFAVLGAAVCLLLLIQLFPTGNVLRILLGALAYLVGGALLILCAGGFLPGRLVVSLLFLTVLLVRVLIFRNVSGWAWLQEISGLCMIAALMFLPMGFRYASSKK